MKEMPATMETSPTTTSDGKQNTFAMQVLLEEVTTLRRRVKELEDDGSTKSSPSVEGDEQAEIASLKKELVKVENDRATMELEFMNQMSSFARENKDSVDNLRSKLFKTEEELASLKAKSAKVGPHRVEELGKEMDELKKTHQDENNKIRKELESTEAQLTKASNKNEELSRKVSSLEVQRNALIEENTEFRMQVETENKAIEILQNELNEMEKHHKARYEKLQADLKQKDAKIKEHSVELVQVHATANKYEEKKGLLLDEITDLRMLLDREEKTKHEYKKRLDELEKKNETDANGDNDKMEALEQRTKDAEKKAKTLEHEVETLQNELRSVATAYKSDVARLEETVSAKEASMEELRKQGEAMKRKSGELETTTAELESEKKELKDAVDEATKQHSKDEQEITGLMAHRVTLEKRLKIQMVEHVSELDKMKGRTESLLSEIESLKEELQEQKEANAKLKEEASNLRSARKAHIGTPTRKVRTTPPASPPTPQTRGQSADSGSPSPRSGSPSVRELANNFEAHSTDKKGNGGEAPKLAAAPSDPGLPTYENQPGSEEMNELQRTLATEVEQNELLHEKIQSQVDLIADLRAEILSLTESQAAMQEVSRKEYERQTEFDHKEVEKLKEKLEEAHKEHADEKKRVEELKSEIIELTSNRLSFEEKAMQSFDKKVAEGQKNYDAELNRLKTSLTVEQMKVEKMGRDHTTKVKELNDRISELTEQYEQELEHTQSQVVLLEHKLNEQSDEAMRLEAEREQLCVTMNGMANTRRKELEELQADLMEKTTAFADLSRQVQALEMQVESHGNEKDENVKLRRKLKDLQSAPTSSGVRYEVEGLQLENQKLQSQVRNITLERRALQEKYNAVVTEKSTNRSLNVLRERNEKLKREVERLNKKIHKYEGSVKRIEI